MHGGGAWIVRDSHALMSFAPGPDSQADRLKVNDPVATHTAGSPPTLFSGPDLDEPISDK